MSTSTQPIVAEELGLLASVCKLLEEVPYVAPPKEAETVAELVRLRDEIPTAKEEDKPALMQQYDHLAVLLEQLRNSRSAPEVDPDSPYFAHLRVVEGDRPRDVCLGKATRIERGVRIVDWRNAPVSRIFYRYQQGEEYEEEIGGRMVAGEVLARRTVAIRDRELIRVDAPEGVFLRGEDGGWEHAARELPRLAGGQGAAFRAHGSNEGAHRRLGTDLEGSRRRADKRLPDIAGLLDPEQFALISQPSTGFVVIRGAAGSGKTTVALHRIAWMAYNDPEVDSERTLFVVFSRALREYVAHVLPALGVHRAQVREYRAWTNLMRKRHFPMLPREARDDAPAAVVRLKLHPALAVALERHVANHKAPATPEQAIDDWTSILTNRDRLAATLAELAPDAFTAQDLEIIGRWCRDRAEELAKWMEREPGEDPVHAAIDVEDEVLLLRAFQLRVGPLRNKGGALLRYRHIAIDEVQDFSPIEVRVLLDCLDQHQSITLAGDTQQHVMKDAGFTSWAEFFGHLGLGGTEVNTLRIAYRSSRPIVELSLAVLGPLREDSEPPLVTRDGPPVELFDFTDTGAAVAFLADALKQLVSDESLASVAVLTPSPEVSALYWRGLAQSEVPRLRLVEDQEFTFAPGIEITEIDQVKGLEFDYVILVEATAAHFPDTSSARRVLHVGVSRAVHQLWITCVGATSPILREALRLPSRAAPAEGS